jgi:hypothetical protein
MTTTSGSGSFVSQRYRSELPTQVSTVETDSVTRAVTRATVEELNQSLAYPSDVPAGPPLEEFSVPLVPTPDEFSDTVRRTVDRRSDSFIRRSPATNREAVPISRSESRRGFRTLTWYHTNRRFRLPDDNV